jgi:D-glycero-alpha-D-manno-heptose-7-phosphate kinase
MILTRAPLRISLAGGGSDLPSFFSHGFGEVLSFAIDQYVYIAAHSYFSGGIKLSYSKTELVRSHVEIQHPLFRNAMKSLDFHGDIELSSFADVPGSGTGLGSSSAFTVALIHTLLTFNRNHMTAHEIASLACKIEIEMCRDPIGKQDQFASAYGGINRFKFLSDGSVTVNQNSSLLSKVDFLNNSLLLYYTGSGRSSTSILQEQSLAMAPGSGSFNAVSRIRDKVEEMENYILEENAFGMGQLLDESWNDKKSLSSGISNYLFEGMLAKAKELGALGGKLVGAGGGGFLLLCVTPEKRSTFIEKFDSLRHLPFKVSTQGVETVYSDGLQKL